MDTAVISVKNAYILSTFQTICNKRQIYSDHIIKTVTHTCVVWHNCRIQYRHAASSFSFNIFENPTSKCALFVDDYVVKWSEQRTKFLLTRSGTSLKIKQKHNWDCDSPTNLKKTGCGWGETPSWLWSALGAQQYTIKSPIWMPHSFIQDKTV